MKRATLNHPKTKALMAAMGIGRRDALGLLTLLWDFAGQYAPDGAIGRHTNAAIADACDWPTERADEMVGHLVRTGWLDEVDGLADRLVVHDWPDHCERWVVKRLGRDKRGFHPHYAHNGRPECTPEMDDQDGRPFRQPSPSPAKPSHAMPTPSPAQPEPPESQVSPQGPRVGGGSGSVRAEFHKLGINPAVSTALGRGGVTVAEIQATLADIRSDKTIRKPMAVLVHRLCEAHGITLQRGKGIDPEFVAFQAEVESLGRRERAC